MPHVVRLDKLLAGQGYGTRGEMRSALRGDRVTVNGVVTRSGAMYVNPSTDEVELDGEPIITAPAPVVMMNKPAGVMTATGDRRHSVVADLLPEKWRTRRLMPIGRLDIDTTGLLLFTDDGDLAHRLIHPKRLVDKLYRATLDAPITNEDIEAFELGVPMGGYKALPAKLERDPISSLAALVTVHEGKYHQVKRMFASRGRLVKALERLSIGPVRLDPMLRPGACRSLTHVEEQALRLSCGASGPDVGQPPPLLPPPPPT
ncbi:MAG: rRNA pseudouridine synthase [Oscillospiraceae bacterium]|jgi:16S rRNA pseudouridine516 synthase|nr:rRNA pseudouridine synthase [Oscillospiraceae bacterium]